MAKTKSESKIITTGLFDPGEKIVWPTYSEKDLSPLKVTTIFDDIKNDPDGDLSLGTDKNGDTVIMMKWTPDSIKLWQSK